MNKEKLENKNPLWINFHLLFKDVVNKNQSLSVVLDEMLNLSLTMIKKENNFDSIKEIIVAFENLNNAILSSFKDEYVNYLEKNGFVNDIVSSFDSLMFNYDYKKEISKLILDLENYFSKIES